MTVSTAEVVSDCMGDRDDSWCERDTDQGTGIVVVVGATGEKRPALAPARLVEALTGTADGAFDLEGSRTSLVSVGTTS